MSEYQWVEFRAIESPLDQEAIEFMHSQSSRAEIDQWRFANEYNFGDFHGDVLEMLRRGYDLYVHYSNFGDRMLYFRFRDGFAFADLVDQYTDGDQICWQPDKKGSGGVLMILPEGDAGTFDEIWDPDTLASDFVPLWEMINRGDMRPLYLAFLALCAWFDPDAEDDDQVEPPIPAGLKQSHPALDRLCAYLEVDEVARQRDETIKAEKARQKAEVERLACEKHDRQIQSIAKDPNPTLLRIDKAIEEKRRPAYQRAAGDLKLLQEALGPVFARAKAEELRSKYPSRSALHSEIRKALDG